MKRFYTMFIALLLMVFVGQASATNYDYWAEVYKYTSTSTGDQDLTRITGANVTFKVLTVNADTASTITVRNSSTSLTNPVTAANFDSATVCNDRVQFRSTSSTHDLIVNHIQGGFSVVIEDFSPQMHKIVLNEEPNIMHHGMIWFSASSAVATDTGVNFLPDSYIHDVRVEVVTVDSAETLAIGTADDADGFRTAPLMTTAGYPSDTGVITSGTSTDYTAVSTYGALLYTAITGSDTANDIGGRSYIGHIVVSSGTNDDLYYTGSSGSDTAAGYLHYWFTRMR